MPRGLTPTLRTATHHGNKLTFATIVLARRSYAVAAGHTRLVTLKLTPAAVQRVSNAAHQRLIGRATATVHGGASAALRKITLQL